MRVRHPVFMAILAAVLTCTAAWADQIILRDGKVYSGKFIRGDSNVVEFRILDSVHSFKIADISQITFKEPELTNPPAGRSIRSSGTPIESENPPYQPAARSQSDARQIPPQENPASSTTIPAGTSLTIRTSTVIDTDRNRVGDAFDATLDEPIMVDSQVVVPRGAAVKGRIAYAKESGRIAGQSQLVLELTEIDASGRSYFLRTSDYTEVGSSRGNRTATAVGGTAALGAIIGAIAGGGKGAAVGAASGAAVGTGVQVLTRGQVLKIPAETELEFRLQSPLTIGVP